MKHYTQFQSPEPDLVPISPPGGLQFCKAVSGRLQVVVRVLNQGSTSAPGSITRVDFSPFGSVEIPTVGLQAGQYIDLHPIDPPPGCFQRDCVFKITVDSLINVDESNSGNNIADGRCIG
jgi:hypothetical protein